MHRQNMAKGLEVPIIRYCPDLSRGPRLDARVTTEGNGTDFKIGSLAFVAFEGAPEVADLGAQMGDLG